MNTQEYEIVKQKVRAIGKVNKEKMKFKPTGVKK